MGLHQCDHFFCTFLFCVNSQQTEAIKEIAEDEKTDTDIKGPPSKRLVKVVSNSTQTEDQKKSSEEVIEEEEKEVETRETQVSILILIFT